MEWVKTSLRFSMLKRFESSNRMFVATVPSGQRQIPRWTITLSLNLSGQTRRTKALGS